MTPSISFFSRKDSLKYLKVLSCLGKLRSYFQMRKSWSAKSVGPRFETSHLNMCRSYIGFWFVLKTFLDFIDWVKVSSEYLKWFCSYKKVFYTLSHIFLPSFYHLTLPIQQFLENGKTGSIMGKYLSSPLILNCSSRINLRWITPEKVFQYHQQKATKH